MQEAIALYPAAGSVAFKLIRTVLTAAVLLGLLLLVVWGVLTLTGLPFVPFLMKFVSPYLWIVGLVYLLLWILVYLSYRDYRWAANLCQAKESFDLGRYKKAVNFATLALAYKGRCGLSYYLRSKAYENIDSDSLPKGDLDMAFSLGIDPAKFDF